MTIPFLYRSYQFTIRSELELPELSPLGTLDDEADLLIRFGQAGNPEQSGYRQVGPFLWAGPGWLWLHVPRVGRFLVREGRELIIEPEPGSDADSIRVFLLGSALGALLLQRGQLVLHGNAVRVGDHCMVCLGRSGVGKSSLAAGFFQRGHALLADDVVSVDADGRVSPGIPRIKLWRDTAEHLDIDIRPLPRIRPALEKYSYPVDRQFAQAPLPVRWIYVLGSDHTQQVRVEPVPGMRRLAPLLANSYRPPMIEGLQMKPRHLQLCGQLACRVHLAQVTRPSQGFELGQLIDHLLADMAEHP
ncbi:MULTISPECIES: hypothetical protein [unclassified Pseudomonas]|uniref:hypothetical protein n=1 Tax=unclassified Pseudomonas TaxID=196821 RepID=UPI0024469919|nr:MULTISPECIES: hypothetical protein [unclassified Pseudomonas]MDH0895945.1 hypothetical protein [Pseudomonas sp. GD03875]MDH1067148.1 hypothetical protein [Pseudomonas sp. GD03985]